MADPLDRYILALQTLTAASLDELLELVSPAVQFTDPFNDCRGRAAYRAVFSDMLNALDGHRFSVTRRAWCTDGPARDALITWSLEGKLPRLGGRNWRVQGSSLLTFDADGLLLAHVDYWDAAGQLYELLPVVGPVARYLRRRLRVDEAAT